MAGKQLSPESLLARLESRHAELLERLDVLNEQVEQALAEFTVRGDEDTLAAPPRA